MLISLAAVVIGFGVDLLIGDPRNIPHPVIIMGRLTAFFEKTARRVFPKTSGGEKLAGLIVWTAVCAVSFSIPWLILHFAGMASPWLRLAFESIMCWQILAAKSLRDESMKVYDALKYEGIAEARRAVSMIVGRDTGGLDSEGVTKACVETVAENTSDGVVAPMFFALLGGAPLGMLYKAVNTMDSMLGYVEEPYKNIGLVPARMDDIFNFIPARLSALFMLGAGWLMRLDVKNGYDIFRRDRYKHASPNSAQTESVCAGLLQVRLSGDASYHGVLHRKPFIGDSLRPVVIDDIPLACSLMYITSLLALIVMSCLKLLAAVMVI